MKIKLFPPLSIFEIGQRANQEDAIAQWDNRLFVLCDGMGGHEKGEVASQTVCQLLVNWFGEYIKDDTFTDDQLREALEYAYTELDKYDDGSLKKMGTTLTLLYIHNKGVTAAHIGDSRIYHVRPGVGVLYQSRDHSLVFDLFQAGEISYEEMATHPQKNIITRAMTPGEGNRTHPDIVHITDVQPGDYFYSCSDGMLEQMSNDELVSIFSSNAADEEKRQLLINATVQNKDNHSAWLVRVKEVVKENADEALVNEEPTARCNAINLMPKKSQNIVEEDVSEIQEAEDVDDVVVVTEALKPVVKKKISLVKLILLLFALIAVLFAVWLFLGKDDGGGGQEEEEHSIYYQEKIEKNSNHNKKDEPTKKDINLTNE